jgi:hypothetical protein
MLLAASEFRFIPHTEHKQQLILITRTHSQPRVRCSRYSNMAETNQCSQPRDFLLNLFRLRKYPKSLLIRWSESYGHYSNCLMGRCTNTYIYVCVCVRRGPLSLVSTIEELLERKSSGFSPETEITAVRDPLHWLSAKVGTNFAHNAAVSLSV